MNIAEFKKVCDALGRLASVRASAPLPQSAIGVQVKNGKMKWISSDGEAALSADMDEMDGDFSYYVAARPLLQSAKVFKGKGEVTLYATREGLNIETDDRQSITLKAMGTLPEANFPKRPRDFRASVPASKETFSQMSKVLPAISNLGNFKFGVTTLSCSNSSVDIEVLAPGVGAILARLSLVGFDKDYFNVGVRSSVWDALRACISDGDIRFGDSGVSVRSGRFELVAGSILASGKDGSTTHWPASGLKTFDGPPDATFHIEKKRLVDLLKGIAPHDEHNRVTVTVGSNGIKVSPFASDVGISLQIPTFGSGSRSFRADYLESICKTIEGKEVTIGWTTNNPSIMVVSPEMMRWLIMLAPVALS
jgi:DNA polymerase III sliding clamp (beta) subunit (PCNA family)